MSQDTRILNLTRGFRLKRNQALRAIEQCACAWVEINVSVRDLTIAESIQARNKQAAERELLAASELPGLVYKPAIGAQAAYAMERRTAFEADRFYVKAIQ
jgi:hypothetical protein